MLRRYVAMSVLRKEEIDEEHRRLRAEYGTLFADITAILFRHDPIGLDFEDNIDEYDCEARTILPRLKTCHSAEDVLTVVHEEFERWFEPDIAGRRERYVSIANDVWALWQTLSMANATQQIVGREAR
jgi:hypothetical protein